MDCEKGRASETETPAMLRIVAPTLLLLAATSVAEARYNCAVKRTPDGFVALREGPSTRHAVLARMRPQEMVGLLDPVTEEIVREGDWLRVRWHPGTRRTAFHMPAGNETTARSGWVRDRLLDCFEE
jgi:hypothetical protein